MVVAQQFYAPQQLAPSQLAPSQLAAVPATTTAKIGRAHV